MKIALQTGLLLLCVSSALAQYDSRSTEADGPLDFFAPPRGLFSTRLAFDAARGNSVLFGGLQSNSVRNNDTWTFDGSVWTKKDPATFPSPRSDFAMAYDSEREVVVLFGGFTTDDNDENAETWEWDGSTWTRITTASSPPARRYADMAYDAARETMVLYGGYDGSTSNGMNDTWEYDGTNWSNRFTATNPGARMLHSLTYDETRGEIVMFGGSTTTSGNATVDETWLYNGSNWLNADPGTAPSRRWSHRCAWNSSIERVVLFGGEEAGGTESNELFTWDGTTWARLRPNDPTLPAPTPRYRHGFTYDVANDNYVAFSGTLVSTVQDDTWVFEQGVWSEPPNAKTEPVFDMTDRNNGIWNFTSINVPAGVTVKFKRNAANTPVTWRASGDVVIDGELDLSGENGPDNIVLPGNEAEPGPGGYPGGLGGVAFNVSGSYGGTAGKGPGGGGAGITSDQDGGHAGHAAPGTGDRAGGAYGSPLSQPVTGGSGGGGGASDDTNNGGNGGAGGGAIHIASSGTITIGGLIDAREGTRDFASGGNGGDGSGGTIRLSANTITGTNGPVFDDGLLAGTNGRIRLEAFTSTITSRISPTPSVAPPITQTLADTARGDVVIVNVGPASPPANPSGNVQTPDVVLQEADAISVTVQTANVPTGTTITVRVAGEGASSIGTGTTDADGIAVIGVTLPPGVGTIQATAEF